MVIFSIIARLRAKIQHARRLTLRAVVRPRGETTGKSEWIKKRAELAVETFAAGKGNCTQSVLCAWEDKIPVDHDTLMKLGAGYGAGMGCMQATCGALIGAVMAAGSVTDGKGTPRTARSILTSFQEKSGATICKDLKGVETGKVLCPCAQCVRNAVLAAGEMLRE